MYGYGDVWTWVAIDPDTKLVPSWLVGMREVEDARVFIADLRSRLMAPRVQITTDGHRPYIEAIESEFGQNADYAMLIQQCAGEASEDASPTARRYSPNKVTDETVSVISGNPDPDLISTSYVVRNNLTMRMGMRRFTRLTNGFSKKAANHAAMVACTSCTTTSGDRTRRSVRRLPRRWLRASPITSGRVTRLRLCSTDERARALGGTLG